MTRHGLLTTVSALFGIAGASAAVVFGWVAYADDRLPTSATETVALLRQIHAEIREGRIAITEPGDQAALIEAAGATAETVYRLASDRGAEGLPLLRITDAPASVAVGDAAEYLLPDGRHVVVGVSLYNGRPYITANGAGGFLNPGDLLNIPGMPDCHIALIGFDAASGAGRFRPACDP